MDGDGDAELFARCYWHRRAGRDVVPSPPHSVNEDNAVADVACCRPVVETDRGPVTLTNRRYSDDKTRLGDAGGHRLGSCLFNRDPKLTSRDSAGASDGWHGKRERGGDDRKRDPVHQGPTSPLDHRSQTSKPACPLSPSAQLEHFSR